MDYTSVTHPFAPVYNSESQILILGSFPSVRSRQEGFYYGHPRNRFWMVLPRLFGEEPPDSIAEKEAFLLRHRIALWDALQSCDIVGSSDQSVRNAVPNDLSVIMRSASVKAIFCNGKLALKTARFCSFDPSIPLLSLPSTSAANAAWSPDRLAQEWHRMLAQFVDLPPLQCYNETGCKNNIIQPEGDIK